MAIWYPSSLIADIRGKLGNHVYTTFRGTHVIRAYVIPSQPNTASQQTARSDFASCGASWSLITATEQSLWNKYASLAGLNGGFASYMKHNLVIDHAGHIDLVWKSHPPQTVSRPEFPRGVTYFFDGSCNVRTTWTSPDDTDNYTQLWYHLDWDYSPTYSMYWKKVDTVRSDADGITWGHAYGSTVRIHLRTRNIDVWGRTTPYTSKQTITVP